MFDWLIEKAFALLVLIAGFYILTNMILDNPDDVREVNTAIEKGAATAIEKGQRAASELSK